MTKEINYFDTPEDRRRGRHGMADLMKGILKEREKEREALMNSVPNRYVNLQELTLTHGSKNN